MHGRAAGVRHEQGTAGTGGRCGQGNSSEWCFGPVRAERTSSPPFGSNWCCGSAWSGQGGGCGIPVVLFPTRRRTAGGEVHVAIVEKDLIAFIFTF